MLNILINLLKSIKKRMIYCNLLQYLKYIKCEFCDKKKKKMNNNR